jgi:hypothetical protein
MNPMFLKPPPKANSKGHGTACLGGEWSVLIILRTLRQAQTWLGLWFFEKRVQFFRRKASRVTSGSTFLSVTCIGKRRDCHGIEAVTQWNICCGLFDLFDLGIGDNIRSGFICTCSLVLGGQMACMHIYRTGIKRRNAALLCDKSWDYCYIKMSLDLYSSPLPHHPLLWPLPTQSFVLLKYLKSGKDLDCVCNPLGIKGSF